MTRLRDKNSSAIVAVKNLAAARDFYEQTLGLEVADASMETQGAVGYRTGGTFLTVYQSEFAGTNKANAVTWAAGEDFDAIITDLSNKGVVFEHYDLPGLAFENGVHAAGDTKLAWFRDPDGNILHIMNF